MIVQCNRGEDCREWECTHRLEHQHDLVECRPTRCDATGKWVECRHYEPVIETEEEAAERMCREAIEEEGQ